MEVSVPTVRKLARIGCTLEEMSYVLGCSVDTLEEFSEIIKEGQGQRKMSLRHRQYQKALKGDTTLLIWLGKQDLKQKDKHEFTGEDGRDLIPSEIVIKLVSPAVPKDEVG